MKAIDYSDTRALQIDDGGAVDDDFVEEVMSGRGEGMTKFIDRDTGEEVGVHEMKRPDANELFRTLAEILNGTVADLETALRHFEIGDTVDGVNWVGHTVSQLKEGATLLGLEADGIETSSMQERGGS